ncbi:putative agrin [Operophtera brumata]|uniref:Putative agrin n=1 Tax=Operophtera brumata TaxID=104452 RepID=A0A0L7KZZ3_OPEBR|nr:putative agrin [Operophtera brumata]
MESSSEPGAGTAVCARVQCAYEATCAVDSNGQPRRGLGGNYIYACLFDCAAAAAASTTSNPVCSSDLRLYPTLCHMKLEACRRQEDLRLCPLPLCNYIYACLFDCAAAAAAFTTSNPVCASDLRLYPTLCHMKLEACRRQEDLRLRPLPLCRGLEVTTFMRACSTAQRPPPPSRRPTLYARPTCDCTRHCFKPCGDDETVTDADGRPVDCGSGPHRTDCPCDDSGQCQCWPGVGRLKCDRCEPGYWGLPRIGVGHTGCIRKCDDSGQCQCRPGVGRLKCDRCEPGYWGLSRIGVGHTGCIRKCDDSGQCQCRPSVGGLKCDRCEPGYWGLPRIGVGHTGCIRKCDDSGQCQCRPGVGGLKCDRCEPGYWGLPRIGVGHTGCIRKCDDSGQCQCRPGVGGLKCDRCEPGYWGLPRIGVGHTGCIPCGCSAFGSVREDCEQMTGRCVCKPGIQGQNCDRMTCYYGAYCIVRSGLATCDCSDKECPKAEAPSVCGSDGRTYLSACHLRNHACRAQSDVVVQAFGPCNQEPHVRRGSRVVRSALKASSQNSPSDTSLSNYIPAVEFQDVSVDTSDSGKPDSPEPELTCIDILPPCCNHFPFNLSSTFAENLYVKSESCATKPANQKPIEDYEDEFVNELNEDYSYENMEEHINVGYEVPLFDGEAFMKARVRLPAKRFDIWAEVSSVCSNGALVSGAGNRDHFWLGFVKNKAVLRWDAGSGPYELHTGRVKVDGKSKVSARRYKKDGVLKLGSATASGSARGRMTSLDVDPFVLSGATSIPGFIGCVHRLRISGRDLIPPARDLTVSSQGVRACTPYNIAKLVCP